MKKTLIATCLLVALSVPAFANIQPVHEVYTAFVSATITGFQIDYSVTVHGTVDISPVGATVYPSSDALWTVTTNGAGLPTVIDGVADGVDFTVTTNGAGLPTIIDGVADGVDFTVTTNGAGLPTIIDGIADGVAFTVTTNGAALPVTLDGLTDTLIFTVTFNGGPQPVTVENIVNVWPPATGTTVFGDSYLRVNINNDGLMTLMSGTAFTAEETATGETGIAAHVKDVSSINVYRMTYTLTLFTTPYTAGDALGEPFDIPFTVLPQGASGIIQVAKIGDADAEESPIDLTFWSVRPALQNSDPFDPPDADLESSLGVVNITPGNYASFNDNSLATRAGIGMAVDLGSTAFYCQPVIREDTTYTAPTDIDIILEILRK